MDTENKRQIIQSFLNCCVMETQGGKITHKDLKILLDFYLNDEMYCNGLSCWKGEELNDN